MIHLKFQFGGRSGGEGAEGRGAKNREPGAEEIQNPTSRTFCLSIEYPII